MKYTEFAMIQKRKKGFFTDWAYKEGVFKTGAGDDMHSNAKDVEAALDTLSDIEEVFEDMEEKLNEINHKL